MTIPQDYTLQHLKLIHVEGNPVLRRHLETLAVDDFNGILILADESVETDMATSDSRSLATLLLLRDIKRQGCTLRLLVCSCVLRVSDRVCARSAGAVGQHRLSPLSALPGAHFARTTLAASNPGDALPSRQPRAHTGAVAQTHEHAQDSVDAQLAGLVDARVGDSFRSVGGVQAGGAGDFDPLSPVSPLAGRSSFMTVSTTRSSDDTGEPSSPPDAADPVASPHVAVPAAPSVRLRRSLTSGCVHGSVRLGEAGSG